MPIPSHDSNGSQIKKELRDHWKAPDREAFLLHQPLLRELIAGNRPITECGECNKHAWGSLRQEDCRELAREWVIAAVKSSGEIFAYYRIYDEIPMEDDLLACLKAFEFTQTPTKEYCHYYSYALRLLWRFLMRRYAFLEQLRVRKYFRQLGEPLGWRLWRLKDFALLRLFLAILVGYAAVGTSEEAWRLLERLSGKPLWLTLLFPFLFVWVFTCFDVQRQVGRIPPRKIALRASLFCLGASVYGAAGAFLQFRLARWLEFCENGGRQCSLEFAVLAAAAAVTLGFIIQLFWQESSSADPI